MKLDIPRITSRLDLLYMVTSEFNAGLDINNVLLNVLTATMASVGASEAMLFVVDETEELEHSIVISDFKLQNYLPETVQTIFKYGISAWVMEHKTGVIVMDTQNDDRWYTNGPIKEIELAKSALVVPLQKPPTEPIGILTLSTDRTNFFNNSDLAMLTIIADQIAFALTNARLFRAEQLRRRVADTLASIAHTINSSLNLNDVLNLILEQLALVVDYDSSAILLYDEDEQVLSVEAARGFENIQDALTVRLPYNENTPNYRAILQQSPVVISDVSQDPFWVKSTSSEKVKSWIGAPLIAHEKVVGILTVDSCQTNQYSKDNVALVAAFAEQAATAVANAQAVDRLQKAEASYSALFEDSTDMIMITDYDGIIQNVNRKGCQILRRPKDAITNMEITFFAGQLKGFLEKHKTQLLAWREASIDIEIADAYQQLIPLELRVRHIQLGERELVEWVGRDISARKEAEKMRQDLVNMLVHDLRGPLGNLINTLDLVAMMVNTKLNDENLNRFLEMGKRTGRALTDLVDSMLDVGRLEQGQVPLQRSECNLVDLLEQVEEQVMPQASSQATIIQIEPLPEDTATVWIDQNMIRRVLINLISNAIKYSPEESLVVVVTVVNPNHLEFSVKDTGPGISEADQERIFEKFARASADPEGPSGVGLGLAFCKLAVEAHGGRIWVESTNIAGQGSNFLVRLPLLNHPDDNSQNGD